MLKVKLLGGPTEKMKIPRGTRQMADHYALADLDEPKVKRLKLSHAAQQVIRKCIREAYFEGWVTAHVERDYREPKARK